MLIKTKTLIIDEDGVEYWNDFRFQHYELSAFWNGEHGCDILLKGHPVHFETQISLEEMDWIFEKINNFETISLN